MAKKGGVSWLLNIILTIFFDPIWQGIRRILKGRILWGIIWFITGGIFGIGWIVDIVCVIVKKDITVLA